MGCLELAFRGPGNGASWGRPGVAGNPGLGVSSSRLKSPLSPRLRGAGASAWELFGPFRRRGPSGSQGRLGPAVFAELRLLAATPARFPGLESPELENAAPCPAPGPLRPPIRRRKRRTGSRIRLSSPLGIREASPDPPSASLPASFLLFSPLRMVPLEPEGPVPPGARGAQPSGKTMPTPPGCLQWAPAGPRNFFEGFQHPELAVQIFFFNKGTLHQHFCTGSEHRKDSCFKNSALSPKVCNLYAFLTH